MTKWLTDHLMNWGGRCPKSSFVRIDGWIVDYCKYYMLIAVIDAEHRSPRPTSKTLIIEYLECPKRSWYSYGYAQRCAKEHRWLGSASDIVAVWLAHASANQLYDGVPGTNTTSKCDSINLRSVMFVLIFSSALPTPGCESHQWILPTLQSNVIESHMQASCWTGPRIPFMRHDTIFIHLYSSFLAWIVWQDKVRNKPCDFWKAEHIHGQREASLCCSLRLWSISYPHQLTKRTILSNSSNSRHFTRVLSIRTLQAVNIHWPSTGNCSIKWHAGKYGENM